MSFFLLNFLQHLPLLLLFVLVLILVLDHHTWEGGVVDINDSVGSGTAPITTMEVDKKGTYFSFLFLFFTASSSSNSCSSSPPSK